MSIKVYKSFHRTSPFGVTKSKYNSQWITKVILLYPQGSMDIPVMHLEVAKNKMCMVISITFVCFCTQNSTPHLKHTALQCSVIKPSLCHVSY